MKILRSVNRRGFSVGTAGFFTILKPNTWFPASRLPKTFPGFSVRTERTVNRVPGPVAMGGTDGPARDVRWLVMERIVEDRNRMRLASAIVGALAITLAMLWWIMHP